MTLVWDELAWEDHLWWQAQDRGIMQRINDLVRDISDNGNQGIGSPNR